MSEIWAGRPGRRLHRCTCVRDITFAVIVHDPDCEACT